MAWKVLKTRVMPIGIDLGTATLKLAQLRQVQGQLELAAAARAEMPQPCRDDERKRMRFLAQRLNGLLKERPFKGRQCIISLPAASTFVQHVRTARMPPEQLGTALRFELDGKLPFDSAEAVIRHVVAGELRGNPQASQEVIVLAASRQVVESYLKLAQHAKLELIGLNVEPCAIVQCFARLFRRAEDAKQVTLFLDLGQAVTQVVIVRGPQMVFARNVTFGAKQIDEAAAAATGMSVAQVSQIRRNAHNASEAAPEAENVYAAVSKALGSLIEEVTKCLRYFESTFPSGRVDRVVFLGGQALDRRLCQTMAQRLNLPAQIGDPFARVGKVDGMDLDDGPDRRQTQPAWAVAVGLSLGQESSQAA
jgi:type IV pilus assembly protein PilM